MKRLCSMMLAIFLLGSSSMAVSAAEIGQDSDSKTGSTTLTTFKEAAYTVVIPESAEIIFDTEVNPIGNIEYREGNLEPEAYVMVSLTEKTALSNDADKMHEIPYEIHDANGVFGSVTYPEDTAAKTKTPLTANITKKAWEEAKAGNYTAQLTFTISYTNPHVAPVQH